MFFKNKEMQDYAQIMAYFSRNQTKAVCAHVLLVEDDSVASPDWYAHIESALDQLNSKQRGAHWLCLKLFTAYRYFDFLTHGPTLARVLLVSSLLAVPQACLFLLLLFILQKRRTHFLVIFFIVFVNTLLLCMWLHSTHISPLGSGLVEFSIGFNTVAIVYPSSVLSQLSDYYSSYLERFLARPNYALFKPKDLLLREFAKRHTHLKEFILEPCPFQHVGKVHFILVCLRGNFVCALNHEIFHLMSS